MSRGGAETGDGTGGGQLLRQLVKSQSGLLNQAQGWKSARPKLKFGIDNVPPVTSSQSLNLSNLGGWFPV